jgi:hypothetical protein
MADSSQLSFNLLGDFTLKVQLRGTWRLRGGLPSAALVEHELESARQVRDIAFDTRELTSWDSSVLTFLVEVSELCRQDAVTQIINKLEEIGKKSTEASVAALSEVLGALSREVADAIRAIGGGKGP